MASYCSYARALPLDNPHRIHHDREHGVPRTSNDELFEQLLLEINQAGLSWDIILKKRKTLKAAYSEFSVKAVAAYTEEDRTRLLADSGIIRNKLKVNAAIYNANVILELSNEYGSFYNWLVFHHPKEKTEWIKLFKKTFKFTGGEIVNEFLMSTGFFPGAHDKDCTRHAEIIELKPMWNQTN
jgi:DNA-3-methyladenine glycosylase I